MKVLSNTDNMNFSELKKSSNHKDKAKLSRNEIRKKIQEHFGEGAIKKVDISSKKSKELQKKEMTERGSKLKGESDIKLDNPNNPNNPVTIEKLKSILEANSFHFNSKEREVLSKILQNT